MGLTPHRAVEDASVFSRSQELEMLTRLLELVPEDEWEPAGRHSADGWAHKKSARATCSQGVESLVSCPFRAERPRRHPGSGRSGSGWPGR